MYLIILVKVLPHHMITCRMKVLESDHLIHELLETLKSLSMTSPTNLGKPIDEVQERQRRRKLAMLKEGCKHALWFTDSFGLDLLHVVFRSRNSSEHVSLEFNTSPMGSSSSTLTTPSDNINTLVNSSNDQQKLLQIVYLLDRFGVSDVFYHELAMINPTLPRSYKVKRVREALSSNVELIRLPQPYKGCYRSIKSCLVELIGVEVCHLMIFLSLLHVYCTNID